MILWLLFLTFKTISSNIGIVMTRPGGIKWPQSLLQKTIGNSISLITLWEGSMKNLSVSPADKNANETTALTLKMYGKTNPLSAGNAGVN
jgi:hypothetical protein